MNATTETILQLAEEIEVTANALKKWRKRSKVPSKYYAPLLDAAEKRGVALSLRDFSQFKTVRPASPAPKKGRAA